MTNDMITYTKISGKELDRLTAAMEDCLAGEKETHVAVACLALAICIQLPTITPDQLAAGIKGASEWIALYASSIITPPDKTVAN